MIGVIVNAVAIVVGGGIGTLIGKKMPEKINDIIMKSMALSIMMIGVQGVIPSKNSMLLVMSMIIGSIIGTIIDIDARLENAGNKLEEKYGSEKQSIAKGFMMASLIFCIGSMAVVGALRAGLLGDNEMLYVKAVLDGITAVILGASYGFGVLFSSIIVLIYEGILYFGASAMKVALEPEVILEVTAVGGVLIVGLALNILLDKKIKIANMLPAMAVPIIYFLIF